MEFVQLCWITVRCNDLVATVLQLSKIVAVKVRIILVRSAYQLLDKLEADASVGANDHVTGDRHSVEDDTETFRQRRTRYLC